MKAMILAAGFGKRMLPLTKYTPKPLLKINNKHLIEYSILNLKQSGIYQVIINLHYLGNQIKEILGNGSKWGVQIDYSEEPYLLDTGGGIVQAIKNNLVGQEPFIVISADIITDFDFRLLKPKLSKLAHLLLVPNPNFNLNGDFRLHNNYLDFIDNNDPRFNYTYANIGIFDPKFFLAPMDQVVPLVKFINRAISAKQVTAEVYSGLWKNIGNPEELLAMQTIGYPYTSS